MTGPLLMMRPYAGSMHGEATFAGCMARLPALLRTDATDAAAIGWVYGERATSE